MARLISGANAPVPSSTLIVSVKTTPQEKNGIEVDASCFLLGLNEKVSRDEDMIFYGQSTSKDGHVKWSEQSAGHTQFSLDLSRLAPNTNKIAVTATIFENKATFGSFSSITIAIQQDGTTLHDAVFDTGAMQEAALILGHLYRRNDAWKFKAIGQGFTGGLKPLAEHFGITITSPVKFRPPNPEPAKPEQKISLSKVSLSKDKPTISLEKKGAAFGDIRVNLNWNQGSKHKGLIKGLFGRSDEIDLDLGCLFELRNGGKGSVQALGNSFGFLNRPPYIQLAGDDRSGSSIDGEWLTINGAKWDEIKRIIIYAFIYEGTASWDKTNGVVRILVPDQPEIVVRLTEGSTVMKMCGIALIENDHGKMKVTRAVKYVSGHQELDAAFNWGLRWVQGSKG